MKKFIENGFDVNWSSPMHAVQSIVVMLLTAPFKLVMAISSKILYLPRGAIEKVVLNSVIVSSVITLADIVLRLYFRTFSLFNGKVPIVMLAGVTAFLAVLYVWVTATDFKVFTELNDLFPDVSVDCTEADTESDVKINSVSEVEATTEQQSEDSKFSDYFDELDADIGMESESIKVEEQPVCVEDTFSICVDKVSANRVKVGPKLSDEQIESWKIMLKKSTEPSEFLSENLLRSFNPEDEIADELVLDCFSIEVIPNTFKALA